jgi:hypothetical protein
MPRARRQQLISALSNYFSSMDRAGRDVISAGIIAGARAQALAHDGWPLQLCWKRTMFWCEIMGHIVQRYGSLAVSSLGGILQEFSVKKKKF